MTEGGGVFGPDDLSAIRQGLDADGYDPVRFDTWKRDMRALCDALENSWEVTAAQAAVINHVWQACGRLKTRAEVAEMELAVRGPEAHNCTTCVDCIHDGHECCGCYDGACCQEGK